jgi:phosphotransferase system  glucose/maltose/N-acetylglucosamine-specific IIC component
LAIENENHFSFTKIVIMQHSAPFLVPVIVSLGAFLMVFGLRYMQNKENMAMIERGIEPKRRSQQANPSQTLKNGLLFIGAGIGLLLAIIITKTFNMEEESGAGIFFALIAIFGGLGMLSAYLYERKNPPTQL